MPTWLFALVVLGIGLGVAFLVDRMLGRKGSLDPPPVTRRERSRWLHFWFTGRFPDDDGGEGGGGPKGRG